MGLLLAIYGEKVSITEALFISVFAMLIVFFVLLIISYLIDITAFFVTAKSKKKDNIKDKKENIAVSDDNAFNKNNDYVVAAIAGAIATYLGTSVDNIKIKSIRRVNQSDSPWTRRGLFNQINKI